MSPPVLATIGIETVPVSGLAPATVAVIVNAVFCGTFAFDVLRVMVEGPGGVVFPPPVPPPPPPPVETPPPPQPIAKHRRQTAPNPHINRTRERFNGNDINSSAAAAAMPLSLHQSFRL